MIRDLLQEPAGSQHHSPVCIVGAGAAGITLALLLRRAGKKVTLLEGGGPAVHSEHDCFGARPTGLPYRGIREGRAHGLGGTTSLWGGQILPLGGIDFEPRSWVNGSGWPLRKADLQPFYDEALIVEGLSNTIASDDAVWANVGERRPVFPHLQSYFSRWCPEPNFAVLHEQELEAEGIDVWLHARAVRAEVEGSTMRGVVVRTPSGAEHTFSAEHIVFCLGAIESSRFFLQPREGGLPWNESGLLGCHFQDHIDCDAATVVAHDPAAVRRAFDSVYVHNLHYLPKLRLTEAEQRSRGLLNVGATLYAPQIADGLTDLRQFAKALLRGKRPSIGPKRLLQSLGAAPTMLRQSARYLTKHRGSLPVRRQLMLRVHCEQEPSGASRIRLSRERDAFGMQQAELSWVISDTEIQTIRSFTGILVDALAPIAKVTPHTELARKSADFKAFCQDSFHHMGGMRMDPSPRNGVVSPELRLHGTNNCYVCSAAVFPTSGFSNPTHTVLALAARLAHHLQHQSR